MSETTSSLSIDEIHAHLVRHSNDHPVFLGLIQHKIITKNYVIKDQKRSEQTVSGLTRTFERRNVLYDEVCSNMSRFLAALAMMKQDGNFYTAWVSFDCGYAMIVQQSGTTAVLLYQNTQ